MQAGNQHNSTPAGKKRRSVQSQNKLSFRELATEMTPEVKNKHHVPGEAISAGGKILYKTAAEYVEQVLDAVRRRKGFALKPGLQIVHQITEKYSRDDQLFSLAIHLDEPAKYPILHSVNVAVYAMRMAADLGYPRKQQLEISLTGLLHDVGMALMPDQIIYKRSFLWC